jgi:leucyl-tRNA synthetase
MLPFAQLDIFRQIYEILDQAKYDYERQQFNTIVSSCMKILNLLVKLEKASGDHVDIHDIVVHKGFQILLCLLAPMTPHITHQLWTDLHYEGIMIDAEWPHSSPIVFEQASIELVVQINGKLRGKITVAKEADQAAIEAAVYANDKLKASIGDNPPKKVIIVPGKLVNIVV